MLFGTVLLMVLASVECRRHGHYHYHPNGTHHEERNQKMTATEENHGFNTYTKHGPGRHVCSSHKTQPVKTIQTFCKPTYKKYMQRCNDNQLCTGVKLVFETAYRDVYINTKNTKQLEFSCCPGWTQITKVSHGCNKPLCKSPCQNGGSCVRPELCSCPKGYKGTHCETDIDECQEQKPCDQICRNTPGSYICDCREMFVLQPDGQSCKMEVDEEPGIEARDLEYELLDKRLFKLETMLNEASEGLVTNAAINDINKRVDTLTTDLKYLKNRIYDTELNHRDLKVMKSKIFTLENKMTKMDEVSKYQENTRRHSSVREAMP